MRKTQIPSVDKIAGETAGEIAIRETDEGAVFEVRVQPRAKRTAMVGVLDGRLKIALASPPVDGRANEELIRFLADALDVPRSSVQILAGEHARKKRICVAGKSEKKIIEMLDSTLPIPHGFGFQKRK